MDNCDSLIAEIKFPIPSVSNPEEGAGNLLDSGGWAGTARGANRSPGPIPCYQGLIQGFSGDFAGKCQDCLHRQIVEAVYDPLPTTSSISPLRVIGRPEVS